MLASFHFILEFTQQVSSKFNSMIIAVYICMYHQYQCCLPGERYHDYVSFKKINMDVFIVILFLLFHTCSIAILFPQLAKI